jgi:hypothetical protein
VRGLGIRLLTLDTETSLYTEVRGLEVPMVLENDYIPLGHPIDKNLLSTINKNTY